MKPQFSIHKPSDQMVDNGGYDQIPGMFSTPVPKAALAPGMYSEIPGIGNRRRSSGGTGQQLGLPGYAVGIGSRERSNTAPNMTRTSSRKGKKREPLPPRTWGRDAVAVSRSKSDNATPIAQLAARAKNMNITSTNSYDSYSLALLERLAIGDCAFFRDAELVILQENALLSPALVLMAQTNRGFVMLSDLQHMVKSMGLKSISELEDRWPLGCKHLMGKSHMKQLKSALAARRKAEKEALQQGEADRGAIVKKQLASENEKKLQAQKEKQERDKAEAKHQKELQKQQQLEEKARKKAEQADKAKLKEETRRNSLLAKKNQKKVEKQNLITIDIEQDEARRRRNTMEAALRLGAKVSLEIDSKESRDRWMEQPASTRYKVIKEVRTRTSGYLALEVGDLVNVTQKADNGYFTGTLARSGKEGIFPGHHVQFAG